MSSATVKNWDNTTRSQRGKSVDLPETTRGQIGTETRSNNDLPILEESQEYNPGFKLHYGSSEYQVVNQDQIGTIAREEGVDDIVERLEGVRDKFSSERQEIYDEDYMI